MCDESVGKHNKLSHDGHDREVGGLSSADEPMVEAFHVGVVSGGDESGHIESLSEFGASGTDGGAALPCTGLSGEGRKAGEGGGGGDL